MHAHTHAHLRTNRQATAHTHTDCRAADEMLQDARRCRVWLCRAAVKVQRAQLSSGAIVSYAFGSASRVLSRDSTSSPPECGRAKARFRQPTRPAARGSRRRSGSARRVRLKRKPKRRTATPQTRLAQPARREQVLTVRQRSVRRLARPLGRLARAGAGTTGRTHSTAHTRDVRTTETAPSTACAKGRTRGSVAPSTLQRCNTAQR